MNRSNVFLFIGLTIGLFFLSACNLNDKGADFPDGIYAIMTTNKGDITLRLEYERVPMTVANFIGLSEGTIVNNHKAAGEPFFDGLTFHRVIPNFMIQGGDPEASGMGGPGYSFKDEIHPELKHNVAGTLSMANAGPATNGSQFFITHNATPWLDGKHSVYGYVTEGLETVYKIANGDVIEHIEIIRKGSAAEAFDAPAVFKEKSGIGAN